MTSLQITINHLVAFLVDPLVRAYPSATIQKLRTTLVKHLSAFCSESWNPNDPERGSHQRRLFLSSSAHPPVILQHACATSGIQWADWMSRISTRELKLYIDPGRVAYRSNKRGHSSSEFVIVWDDARYRSSSSPNHKTLAQQLLEDDARTEKELFSLIAEEVHPQRLRVSGHSRCSSLSSTLSSSSHSASFAAEPAPTSPVSRRQRARQSRVVVDTSKTSSTAYDGGKTSVLTGGVMLGGVGPRSPVHLRTSSARIAIPVVSSRYRV